MNGSIQNQDKTIGKESFRIGPFQINYRPSLKEVIILKRMCDYFDDEKMEDVLVPFADKTANVSLRALDWLVTNFSKSRNIVLSNKSVTHQDFFNIYNEYRTELSYFRRKNFDPFRRRHRISFDYKGNTYTSTIGQCNFLAWAHKNGVMQYALQNISFIEKDMNGSIKEKSKQGRRELSSAPTRKVNVYSVRDTKEMNEIL